MLPDVLLHSDFFSALEDLVGQPVSPAFLPWSANPRLFAALLLCPTTPWFLSPGAKFGGTGGSPVSSARRADQCLVTGTLRCGADGLPSALGIL